MITTVTINRGEHTICYSWNHDETWKGEDKLRCCLLKHTIFAQTMPNSPISEMGIKIIKLIDVLFDAYSIKDKPEKSFSELIHIEKLSQSEETIILVFLGLAVVVTGFNGLSSNNITVNADLISNMLKSLALKEKSIA